MRYRVLLAGDTGTGKTSQFLTMPKPRYAHIFDPAAHTTLGEHDAETTQFFPEGEDLDLMPRTAIKAGKRQRDGKPSAKGPMVYLRWAETFAQELAEGRFNGLGSFMLDSATLMGLHLMERQRWLGDKQGREDERQDHKLAGDTMINALWAVFSLPCHVLVTMHTKYQEVRVGDTKTGELRNRLTVPGGSQLMLPRYTSACWYTSIVEEPKTKKARYVAMTRPQPRWPHVRSPRGWGDLKLYHDLTIEDWDCPERYGIGALIGRGE